MKIIFTFLAISILTGCAETIDSFYRRPVIEDSLSASDNEKNKLGTLAVTAQRRLIVANMKSGTFCAEPPPEAADSVTSAIAAALQANISEKENVNIELASSFSRYVNQLYRRAHTVQLFRDAAFYYCVDAVNSSNVEKSASSNEVKYESYSNNLDAVLEKLMAPLTKEIDLYYETEMEKAKNPTLATEFVICDSSASLEAGEGTGNTLLTNLKCRPIESNTPGEDNSNTKNEG